jgi:hypothetical protein
MSVAVPLLAAADRPCGQFATALHNSGSELTPREGNVFARLILSLQRSVGQSLRSANGGRNFSV